MSVVDNKAIVSNTTFEKIDVLYHDASVKENSSFYKQI